jgi:hypothetical protein
LDTQWVVIVIAVAAIAFILYDRQRRSTRDAATRKPGPSGTGDFTADRETSRLDRMSEEDRAWEQASLSKSQRPSDQAEAPAVPVSAPLSGRDGKPQV